MSIGASDVVVKSAIRITDVGHSTILIELAGVKILTDPWFTDPFMGIVVHPHGTGMRVEDLPELDLILISHGHFDHCDLGAVSRMNKSASVIVPDEKTAARIRKLGFADVAALAPWESRLESKITVTALPADHPAPERTYVMAFGDRAVFFGGDTRYIKDFREIGEKFDLTAALLPISGIKLPFSDRFVMDPAEAAEAAVQLKTRVAIPIHYNMSLKLPLLRGVFDRIAPGTPERFEAEMKRRSRQVKVVPLRPGESWECERDAT